MQLKLLTLTGTALALWLVPLYALDKTQPVCKGIQGASLMAAVACAGTAAKLAADLRDSEAYQAAQRQVAIEDLQDELATEAWVSQQQRRLEAAKLLHPASTEVGGELVETPPNLHQLEALLHQHSTTSPPIPVEWEFADPLSPPSPLVRGVIIACKRAGWSQSKTISAVWGVEKSGSDPRYKAARHWYLEIVDGAANRGEEV